MMGCDGMGMGCDGMGWAVMECLLGAVAGTECDLGLYCETPFSLYL